MKKLEDMNEVELHETCNQCGRALEAILGKNTKFALMIFDDPKIAQYVSSCTRESMIEALKETLERLTKKQDVRRGL